MLATLKVLNARASFVDYVVLFNEDTPSELLDALKPDIHVKAADYNVDKMPETPVVRKNGGEVVCVPLEPGYATTDLIGEILKRFGDGEHEKVDSGRGGYEVGK
ncbi:MAG: Bifunctional protein RfaE, domain II [Berkelbacteria bacterium GW2011_GWA2_38_9]|uniref:Bifunctional protein RfaE, domain II n=1 Tax=Berkelbacteria bacterium GW2011_GWA2_38_9 TaxID=1618334 RepID=A0A0G0PCR1_9BACT|nr:MAG: Bifunctional protein RfaE, domain II [Berkelbacteria bacterium GW2011_GWA2_38_9]